MMAVQGAQARLDGIYLERSWLCGCLKVTGETDSDKACPFERGSIRESG